MKMNRKARRAAKYGGRPKIAAARGFGPTHAENSLEGQDAQPGAMPDTDTVPAMLTPREAVLNRNAAELAGRGNIEQLNQEGNQLAQKGVDLAAEGETSVGGEFDKRGASPLLQELMGMVEGDRRQQYKDLIRQHLTSGHQVFTHQQFDYNDPVVQEVLKELGAGANPAPAERDEYPSGLARGQAVVPGVKAVLPKVPHDPVDFMKFLPTGDIRRSVKGEVPKLAAAKGDDDVSDPLYAGIDSLVGGAQGGPPRGGIDLQKEENSMPVQIFRRMLELYKMRPGPLDALPRQLPDNEEDLPPEQLRQLQDEYRHRQNLNKTIEVQKGTKNVKPKQSKPKSKPAAPPQNGSPYVQGFQQMLQRPQLQPQQQPLGFQGGGYVPLPKPGVSTDPLGSYVPGGVTQGIDPIGKPFQGTPAQFYAARWQAGHPGQTWGYTPAGAGTGDTPRGVNPAFPGRGPGGVYPGGNTDPLTPPAAQSPQQPMWSGGAPYGGTGGAGNYMDQLKQMPSNSFYPQQQKPLAAANGTASVPGYAAGEESIAGGFGAPPQLVAGNMGTLLAALKQEGQKQGLNAMQIAGLAKAFTQLGGVAGAGGGGGATDVTGQVPYGLSNMTAGYQGGTADTPNPADPLWKLAGGGGDMQSGWDEYWNQLMDRAEQEHPSARSSEDYEGLKRQYGIPSAWSRTRGYQGGISDIGYPPFIAPGSEYHGDRGGWLGQYDQNYMVPRYARGSSNVGFFR